MMRRLDAALRDGVALRAEHHAVSQVLQRSHAAFREAIREFRSAMHRIEGLRSRTGLPVLLTRAGPANGHLPDDLPGQSSSVRRAPGA